MVFSRRAVEPGSYHKNKASYFGDFVDGKFHGHGTLVNDQDEEYELN